MIVTILALIASIFALSYHKGETFSYNFHTTVDTTAGAEPESAWKITMDIDLKATFTVLSLTANGAYMQLVVSNFQMKMDNGEETETIEGHQSLDELFSAPLYFKLLANGSITDVISSKKDTSEVVNMKTAVAFALRTNLKADLESDFEQSTVIDPMGKHVEYTSVSRRGNSITIDTYYSDSDFVGFSDRNVLEGDIAVETQATHTVEDEKIVGATATTTVTLSQPSAEERANEDAEEGAETTPIVVSSTYILSDYTAMEDSNVENAEITSIAKFLSQNKGFGMVANLRDAFYGNGFSSLEKTVAGASTSHCPSACNLCQSISGSKTCGNSNAGLEAAASAVIGVQKGCKAAQRSYIVGAYATLDIKLIGKKISAVNAYAEYGQLNGKAQRNGVSVSLFGISLYNKSLTGLDCKSKTITVFNSSKSFSLTYSIPVWLVTVSLKATLSFKLKADVIFQICPNQFNASVTFKPSGTVTLSGSASASVPLVASATAKLSGSITDYLDPKAYVNGNTCKIGFVAKNHLSGITAKITGTYTLFGHKGKDYTLWTHTWGGSTQTIIDRTWS